MGLAYIIAIIILISVFGLALLVLAGNRRSSVNQTFSALIFFIAFWLSSSLFVDLSLNLTGVIFWAQTSIVWAAAIPSLWLYFTYVFPRKEKIGRIKQVAILLPALLFLVLSPTKLNIKTIQITEEGVRSITHGPLYFLLFIHFLVFSAWGFIRLTRRYKKSHGVVKAQIKYILIGTLTSLALAICGTVVFPYLGIEAVTNFSSLTVLFFIVFSTYAILRHHLMNVRVMTAEVFTGLLVMILLVNLFSFESREQLMLNTALFFAAVVFGIFLIKAVLQEINARQEIEQMADKLKKANIKLRRLDKAKSEFISIASHQLRTPLSAIKGYVSMILDGTYGRVDETKKEVLNRVYSSNERLITLVNDLLNLSRIERGKLQFEFRRIDDLEEILDSVVQESMVNAQKKGLAIEYSKKDFPALKADPHKLRQVFVNIIDNAIKYTEKGSLKIQSKITASKIIISFKDTGMGMTREEIDSIYEKFRRGRGGEKYHAGGMGIGLYICHKVLEAHDGKIRAKSQGRDRGTTFYVELPYKKEDAKETKKD